MKAIIAALLIFCTSAHADKYVQASVSLYDSRLGAANSQSLSIGYEHQGFDSYVGVFNAKQNTKYYDFVWSGLFGVASYNKQIGKTPVSAFAAYQVSQLPSNDWDGKYALGLTYHAKDFNASVYTAPRQRAWDNSKVDAIIGLSFNTRFKF